MTERAVPILPSRDWAETLTFYGTLGFENIGAPPERWDYLIIGRGALELHVASAPDVDPLRTAGSCYVFVDDAQALYEQWKDLVVPDEATGSRVMTPSDTDYRMREFAVVDRNGHPLRIGSSIPS